MQSCLGIKGFIPKTILLYIMKRMWCFLLSLLLLRGFGGDLAVGLWPHPWESIQVRDTGDRWSWQPVRET